MCAKCEDLGYIREKGDFCDCTLGQRELKLYEDSVYALPPSTKGENENDGKN